jgi:phosphoglycolate phosphatase-like HAD superfamily hydrolase
MPRTLVLFDIDGTILLTSGAGRRAIADAIGDLVDAAAFDRVRFDGKTDPQIVAELLTEAGHENPGDRARIDEVCDRYVAMLERELAHPAAETRLLPGIVELLDALDAQSDAVVGLLTGNVVSGAALKLRAAGIDPARFQLGAYGSDAAHRPALPPIAVQRAVPLFGRELSGHDVVIIGDTPSDVRCGESVGARAIGVATGSFSTADLAAAGAHAVFEDLSDTPRVLRAILD